MLVIHLIADSWLVIRCCYYLLCLRQNVISERRIELIPRILRRILRNKYILLLGLVLKRSSFSLPSLLVRKVLVRAFRRTHNSKSLLNLLLSRKVEKNRRQTIFSTLVDTINDSNIELNKIKSIEITNNTKSIKINFRTSKR